MAQETAEQKLLKIIENAETAAKAPAPAAQPARVQAAEPTVEQVAASVKGTGLPSISAPAFLKNLLGLIKGRPSENKTAVAFGLREFNRLLFGAILVFGFVFVKSFISGMDFSKKEVNLAVKTKTSQIADDLTNKPTSLSDYLVSITRRNIFLPFEKKEAEEEVAAPTTLKEVSERTKDLKLVGISWLDTAESASALIENTTSGVTYFLRVGEKINNVLVKKIYADAVILSYEEEEIEFRL